MAKRIDLHCHSVASNVADEAMLNAIGCPESFSSPAEVYNQAKRNGMDFVTLTDHDSIAGVQQLHDKRDVLVGEELTCYFPEDRCKIHLLVWGLNADDHRALQAAADDIYQVAAIVEHRRLAHSAAHPLYRQNDRLEKWHLERLVLMFKGFETLNGAHSVLHRQAVEPILDELTEQRIAELADAHGIFPRWPRPHEKARTGGAMIMVCSTSGGTFTEFPDDVVDLNGVLDCLREGRCRPGGEAGSSLKLAHNFYGVGIRYHVRKMRGEKSGASLTGLVLDSLIGERRQLRRRDWVKIAVKSKVKKLGRRLARPFGRPAEATGSQLLMNLFLDSCRKRVGEHAAIGDAVRQGRAALGEHEAMFGFLSSVNRDVAAGIAESVETYLDRGQLSGLFDSVSAIAAQQFLLMPYYFALFHQNRERNLMSRMTGRRREITSQTMKLGVFTDTFDEVNGVGRFIQDMSRQAQAAGRTLVVHTSVNEPRVECASRKNFVPLLARPLPYYADQAVAIPPLTEVLEWADRQQFDAIHVHTPGPMGLCGWLVGKMLRVPVLGTYHTDFPRYVQDLIGDHRLTTATAGSMRWFYGQTSTIFSRSKDYRGRLAELGFEGENVALLPPGVDTKTFTPEERDLGVWNRLGVRETYKLLYAGRISREKNMDFLLETFRQLCGGGGGRADVALVMAGDGPYRAAMEKSAHGLPVYFLGCQKDSQLATLYASSDLFVFPSKTDTLGQVVIEAQAAGLPVLVSDQGGPKEVMDDRITGRVLAVEQPAAWSKAIDALLNDTPQRLRMSRTAPQRMARFSLENMFEALWSEHLKAAIGRSAEARPEPAVDSARRRETAVAVWAGEDEEMC